MKKLIFAISVLCAFAFAEYSNVNVCNEKTCYMLQIYNMKSWEWLKMYDGTKFVRIYTYDKHTTDITGRELKVEVKKNKRK